MRHNAKYWNRGCAEKGVQPTIPLFEVGNEIFGWDRKLPERRHGGWEAVTRG